MNALKITILISLANLTGCATLNTIDPEGLTTEFETIFEGKNKDWSIEQRSVGYRYIPPSKKDTSTGVDYEYILRGDKNLFLTQETIIFTFSYFDIDDVIAFRVSDIGRVKKSEGIVDVNRLGKDSLTAKVYKYVSDNNDKSKLRPFKFKISIPDTPYNAPRYTDTKGITYIGIHRAGNFREGMKILPDGTKFIGTFNDESNPDGRITRISTNGRITIEEYKDGVPSKEQQIVINPDGSSAISFIDENGIDSTEKRINSLALSQVYKLEDIERDKLTKKFNTKIERINSQRSEILNNPNSAYNSAQEIYSTYDGEACKCYVGINICLTSYPTDWSWEQKEAADRRRNARKKICRELERSGLLGRNDESFNEMLRKLKLSSNMSSGFSAKFKSAKEDLIEADRLLELSKKNETQRDEELWALRLEEYDKRKERLAEQRKQIEAQLERQKQEDLNRYNSWITCVTKAGFDLDKKEEWTVWPGDC